MARAKCMCQLEVPPPFKATPDVPWGGTAGEVWQCVLCVAYGRSALWPGLEPRHEAMPSCLASR
eukprot:366062-Chlamydomonas_euryale.AAC.4